MTNILKSLLNITNLFTKACQKIGAGKVASHSNV